MVMARTKAKIIPVGVQQDLKSVDYAARKEDLIEAAQLLGFGPQAVRHLWEAGSSSARPTRTG
jgi:hypothetical protein